MLLSESFPEEKKNYCHHRHRLSACNASMLLQGGGPTPKRSTSSCKDSTSRKKKRKSQPSQDKQLSPGVNKDWKGGAAGQLPRDGTLERANVQESQAWLSSFSFRVAPCVYINRTYYARRVSGAETCARAQATLSIEVEKSDMTFLQH